MNIFPERFRPLGAITWLVGLRSKAYYSLEIPNLLRPELVASRSMKCASFSTQDLGPGGRGEVGRGWPTGPVSQATSVPRHCSIHAGPLSLRLTFVTFLIPTQTLVSTSSPHPQWPSPLPLYTRLNSHMVSLIPGIFSLLSSASLST